MSLDIEVYLKTCVFILDFYFFHPSKTRAPSVVALLIPLLLFLKFSRRSPSTSRLSHLIAESDTLQLRCIGRQLTTAVLRLLWRTTVSWRATLTRTCSRWRTASLSAMPSSAALQSRTRTTIASWRPRQRLWSSSVG